MSDFWGVLMALMVIVAPMWLAWVLLTWSERCKGPGAVPRDPGKR